MCALLDPFADQPCLPCPSIPALPISFQTLGALSLSFSLPCSGFRSNLTSATYLGSCLQYVRQLGIRPCVSCHHHNLPGSFPLSLRACSGVPSGLYVTAVNVCDPSTVPSNDPYSWLALRPNLSQSFKARSLLPIFTVSIHAIWANRTPCLVPRLAPQGLVLITGRLGDVASKNEYSLFFFSHPIYLIPTMAV